LAEFQIVVDDLLDGDADRVSNRRISKVEDPDLFYPYPPDPTSNFERRKLRRLVMTKELCPCGPFPRRCIPGAGSSRAVVARRVRGG
jgi:hypothetical protein